MDPIRHLTDEHRIFRETLKQLEEGGPKRGERFAALADLIALHSAGEEEAVYPQLQALAEDDETEDEIAHAYEEHHLVDVQIDEIAALDAKADEETWTAKVHVLRETLEHHLDEEEEDLFPLLKAELSGEELTELAEEMAEARAEAQRWKEEHPKATAQEAAIARAAADAETD